MVGRNGYRLISASSEMPLLTRTVRIPASRPEITSVSMRSPIMTVCSECAPMVLSALRIITGLGLPMKYGSAPVAAVISAATEPVAGRMPVGEGPVTSGLVQMNRAPPMMRLMAVVMASKE